MGIPSEWRAAACAAVVSVGAVAFGSDVDDVAYLAAFGGTREQLVLPYAGAECD